MPGRSFNSGEYRYGFNGMEKDDELKGITGSSYDFGARMYDPRVGRWLSGDPKQHKYPFDSPFMFTGNNPIIMVDPNGEEKVVVAGVQNDNSAANKLMFVHQAMRQLIKYKQSNPEEVLTFAVFTEGYTENQLNRMQQWADENGFMFIPLNSSNQLTNYLNSHFETIHDYTPAREYDKITNVDVFAHGVTGAIEFGYQTDKADESRFDEKTLENINPKAFDDRASFCSYACRTGLGNPNIVKFAWPWEDAKPENSLAQKTSSFIGITVEAYMVRTNYSTTLSTAAQRKMIESYDENPYLRNTGYWRKEYKEWKIRLSKREQIDGATFDPSGAANPVGTDSMSTPVGVDNDKKTFKP